MTSGTDIAAYIADRLHGAPVDPALAIQFPGQGSQKIGMGLDLLDSSNAARLVFAVADRTLDTDLSRLCFEGPADELTRTSNAQPAILATSVALLTAALESGTLNRRPAFMAGHSLGEYTALVAAGALSFEDALVLVHKRGLLMERAGDDRPGTMAAVVALSEEDVEAICRDSGAEPCNYNSPTQMVVGGAPQSVELACRLAKERGGRGLPLNVSGAFHTSLMETAAAKFAAALDHAAVTDPVIPVLGNVAGLPLSGAAGALADLREQIKKPVRWWQSIVYMMQHGAATFTEVGPGRVLTLLLQRAAPESFAVSIDSAAALTSASNV